MRNTFFLCAAAGLTLSLPAMADSSKTYDFSGFDELSTAAGISVVFEQADTYSVTAEFERGGPDDIKIRMDDDRLYVSRKSGGLWKDNKARVTVYVTAPEIEELKASSGSSLKASGLTSPELEVDVSSGASVKLSGTCGELEIDASSGASLSAKELQCQSVEVSANSGASIKTYASQSAESKTSSGASVTIYGNPADRQANKSMSGGSTRFR